MYATARSTDAIGDLAESGCRTLPLDVTDEGSMRDAVDAVVESEGAVGCLVNNAGYSQSGALETLPMERLRAQFETNVFGLVRMCQLVLPAMRRQRWGRIVNLSSMGGKLSFPGGGAYHATKYAVEALSAVLRFEVGGVRRRCRGDRAGADHNPVRRGAAGSIGEATGTPADTEADPYASFNAAVGSATLGAYDGPLARLGGPPESVAKTIERALAARRPRTRYKVTASARLALAQRKLGDRAWDAFVATQFRRPGAQRGKR